MAYIEGILEDEKERLLEQKYDYENKIISLPKGVIVYKKIKGKKYPYLVFREKGKVKTVYIKENELKYFNEQIEDRKRMEEALKNIKANLKAIGKVIKNE